MSIKVVANTFTVSTVPVESTVSRYVRLHNSNTTVVANVNIGANNSVVNFDFVLMPGEIANFDLGYIGGAEQRFISLSANVASIYATPIAGGS